MINKVQQFVKDVEALGYTTVNKGRLIEVHKPNDNTTDTSWIDKTVDCNFRMTYADSDLMELFRTLALIPPNEREAPERFLLKLSISYSLDPAGSSSYFKEDATAIGRHKHFLSTNSSEAYGSKAAFTRSEINVLKKTHNLASFEEIPVN